MLGLFGGKIENKENEKDAIIREIYEETNLKIKKFSLLNSQTIYFKNQKYKRYVFFTKLKHLPSRFYINEGKGYKLLKKEDLQFGRSITDACIDIETTKELLAILYNSLS